MKDPSIGLLSPYFGLFDAAMPTGFRHDRERHLNRVQDLLATHGTVYASDLVDSEEAGAAAGELLAAHQPDILVCAPAMAAPPTYTLAALERLPDVPIVVLGIQETVSVPGDYNTEEATRRSLPVGVVMLTNTLVRQGRAFITLFGAWDDDDLVSRVDSTMVAVLAAARVRGARLLSIGTPIPGYADIEATREDLAQLSVAVVNVEVAELNEAFERVRQSDLDEQVEAVRGAADSIAVDDDVLRRSARLACAMRDLCASENVVGGAVNCHGDTLRWNPDVGITACLGVSRLTADGFPFACTGDVPTAVALVLGRAIAGSALYCELYQLDLARDWVLVANGGEGDLTIRDTGRPLKLLTEDHYLGDRGPGTAVAFSLPRGEATLTSLSPIASAAGGWRLVVAEGAIVGSQHDEMEGPNGMFRFNAGPVEESFRRWAEAGATHHAALLPGAHAERLAVAAKLLGIELKAF